MRTRDLTAALLTAGLIGVAGCGQPAATDDPPASAEDATLFGDCRVDDPALVEAEILAEVDLDGSETRTPVRLVPSDAKGPCRNALVATLGDGLTALDLEESVLDTDSARVIQLRGTQRQLLLVHADPHPRGGYDLRLFGAAEGILGEVLHDGRPLLGFVATDGGAAPATATCTRDGGIALLEARTHEPPGIVLAWDVYRTTYSVKGVTADLVSEKQIRDGIADPTLRKQMPQLFESSGQLRDCTVPA